MGRLIQLLFENPVLLIIVGTWLLGVFGKVLSNAGKRATRSAQELREQAQRRMPTQLERRQDQAELEAAERPARPRRITQEEALAEMRRLLRGEPATGAAPSATEEQRQRRVELVPAEGPRTSGAGDLARRLGQADVHVDHHIGEAMQQRGTPASGQVGHSDLGSLGGRTHAHATAAARVRPGLIDVHDIKRMLVMREVLGPPLALRPDWGPGQIH